MKWLRCALALGLGLAAWGEEDERLLPVEDPFVTRSRLNIVFNNSLSTQGESNQEVRLNPVLALDSRSTLQFTVPMAFYLPGASGNSYQVGPGDFSMQYFRRFETSEAVAHGFALAFTSDSADTNLGSGGTFLGTAYALEYKPDSENKLLVVAGYRHSLGRSDGGDATREVVLRLQGFHYLDQAYLGLELRQEYYIGQSSYRPFALFTVGGEVTEGLQLWGSLRLPLNEEARGRGDRLNYSIGLTVPL